jgi:hypothetical protein
MFFFGACGKQSGHVDTTGEIQLNGCVHSAVRQLLKHMNILWILSELSLNIFIQLENTYSRQFFSKTYIQCSKELAQKTVTGLNKMVTSTS